MIARGVKLQLIVFALLTALGVSYVGARYVGLTEKLFGSGYVVTANFAESGGIFPNAEVTYRGVTVGRVGELHLSQTGVFVPLRLESGVEIPTDVRAVVANRSAIGEQYVDLQPTTASGPYLQNGDAIPREDTHTPLSTNTMLVNLDELVNSVGRDQLRTVVDELGKAFAGTGGDLQRLVDEGNALTAEATSALPETIRLIDDGKVVLDTQRDSAGQIKSFSRDLADFAEALRRSDGDVRGVLSNGVRSSRQVTDLLQTTRPAFGVLVANLLTVSQVQAVRLPALEQILVTYPANVAGGYSVVPGDGTAHFGLVLNNNPHACTKGYESTKWRDPANTSYRPANTKVRCEEPQGSPTSVRGAQNAPRGPNTPTYQSGEGSSSGSRSERGGPSSSESAVAGYDPMSGQTFGPDGQPITIGSSGGEQAAFGEDSWKWLLISPLVD